LLLCDAIVYLRCNMIAPRSSFRLTGHSMLFDRRRHALRADLADVALAGMTFAPHYAEAAPRECAPPFLAMYNKPNGDQVSELLAGEGFGLLDVSGGWAWGFSIHDHYVGYVKADALIMPTDKAQPIAKGDFVDTAIAFLDIPYVWGGRGGAGIDCSGLVQRALTAAGITAPRDSDMQLAETGDTLPNDAPLMRGDLIFFPGHVGIMTDGENLLHATRHYGKTVIEPLADVVARVSATEPQAISARKRVSL
jgi:NlpC/P60 family/Bacterial dipeptidyl-peptidase Sh3 domain